MGGSQSSETSTIRLLKERHDRFKNTDRNNDGFITMEEFENAYMEKIGDRPTWKDWSNFIDCDINKDKKISIQEFANFFEDDES